LLSTPLTLMSKLLLSKPEEEFDAEEASPASLPVPLSKLSSLFPPAPVPLATRKKSSIVQENLNSKSAADGADTSKPDDVNVEGMESLRRE